MKIVRLIAENVKRIKVVEVVPRGAAMVVVGGANDAGKSSLLDSIEMALGGKSVVPSQPVRKGAKGGRVFLDLGEMTVTRTFTAEGGTFLKVENKDGSRFSSPQAMLDKLYGALTFDPLAFERQEPDEQAAVLRAMVGLDFSALEKDRQRLYDERTLENRALKALQIGLDASQPYEGAPAEEISVAALTEELEAAEGLRRAAVRAGLARQRLQDDCRALAEVIEAQHARIAELEAELETARRVLEFQTGQASVQDRLLGETLQAAAEAEAAVPDTTAIRARLREAEATNLQVRTNREHAAKAAMLEDAKARVADLTKQIDDIDAQKAERLASAAYPVPGLAIDQAGVVQLNGLPFEQASTSDRIRVSVAMGLAMHPKLRILLVRDGSLLGEAKLKVIEEMVRAHDAQLWLEMMQESPTPRTTVFIEAGVESRRGRTGAPSPLPFPPSGDRAGAE